MNTHQAVQGRQDTVTVSSDKEDIVCLSQTTTPVKKRAATKSDNSVRKQPALLEKKTGNRSDVKVEGKGKEKEITKGSGTGAVAHGKLLYETHSHTLPLPIMMLTGTIEANENEVIALDNSVNGDVVFCGQITASNYLLMGEYRESNRVRRDVVFRVTSPSTIASRGIYYILTPVDRRPRRSTIRQIVFAQVTITGPV